MPGGMRMLLVRQLWQSQCGKLPQDGICLAGMRMPLIGQW
jgi:hypothetical protein